MGQSRPLIAYFRSFLVTISIQIKKSIDGVLGIQTQDRRMVGADEAMELWRPPNVSNLQCTTLQNYSSLLPKMALGPTLYFQCKVLLYRSGPGLDL